MELIAFAAQPIHAHTTDYNLGATGSLSYGVTDHLMLTAAVPYIRRDDLRVIVQLGTSFWRANVRFASNAVMRALRVRRVRRSGSDLWARGIPDTSLEAPTIR